jgi:hypothetical protein
LVQHDFDIINRGVSATLVKHESTDPLSRVIAAMKVAHNEYKHNNANTLATVDTILGNEPNRVLGAPFMGYLPHPTNQAHDVAVVTALNRIYRAEVTASRPNPERFGALKSYG